MNSTLVDSSVILDVVTRDPLWYAWSADALTARADAGLLAINPIIFAEVSVGFPRIEALEEALPPTYFARLPLPWDAAFLAGRCFLEYRRRGPEKRPAPGFLHRRPRGGRSDGAAHPRRRSIPYLFSAAAGDRTAGLGVKR